ncbi:transcription antitermination factor NusB [Caryophanon tenue]|uniref:Transcription antitermination protein NusB n=1 Tax=Caryophanon tenue TaxID=33978 RepID=A0A1C0YNI1_9BACL|nr:transcription antitermination factor NusB [Caryophanon tenue]OCS88619.1 transcription antitermination factor NusB [Caryophanon tenue]
MKRHEARQKALQALFQLDNTELTLEEAMDHALERSFEEEQATAYNSFFEQLVRGTTEHKEAIDELLTANLENWSLSRLPKIERTVLRLAVYELRFSQDAPHGVVLNEAIELSKTFGDEKSSKFVNGVLSKFIETK